MPNFNLIINLKPIAFKEKLKEVGIDGLIVSCREVSQRMEIDEIAANEEKKFEFRDLNFPSETVEVNFCFQKGEEKIQENILEITHSENDTKTEEK